MSPLPPPSGHVARFAAVIGLSLGALACTVPVAEEAAFASSDAADTGGAGTAEVQIDAAGGETSACPGGCDDQNPCTTDTCEGKACSHAELASGACDDGNPCTVDDACAAGACTPGKPKVCSSDDPCVLSKCDQTQGGKCKLVEADDGIPCSDGTACTEGDKCKGGICKGASIECKDDNPCSTDACDAQAGCTFTPATGKPCDDDNPCTLGDACSDGKCNSGKPKECLSPEACYTSKCSLGDGKCKLTEIPEGEACNDGSACTSKDACKGGACKGVVITCDDKNPCTIDSCDLAKGCTAVAADGPCDDGSPCTTGDACKAGTCVGQSAGASVVCDDQNPCTADTCDAKSGCSNAPADGSCDDGNPCTKGDACKAGACAAGANACNCQQDADCAKQEDGDLCNGTLFCDKSEASPKCKVKATTVVTCDAKADTACSKATCDANTGKCGTVAVKDGTACNADDTVCTQGDACSAGLCKPGAQIKCDDGNACTTDGCGALSGCGYVANTAWCDADANACTAGDKCENKVCLAGAKQVCDDGEACTADSCHPASGKCVFDGAPFQAKPCDADGSVCTEGDACAAGKCVAGKFNACNDANPCTTDSCDAKKGCANLANTLPCDDNNKCSTGDQCAQGVCSGAAQPEAVFCDDKNPCTNDVCAAATGCAHPAAPGPCEDGNACTVGDACSNGACVAGKSQCACQSDADCKDDGDLCNGIPKCDKSTAQFACKVDPATIVSCNPGSDSACSANLCAPATGKCAMAPINGKGCSDNNACTQADACAGGTCAGVPTACDDKNPCSDDGCDTKSGCKSAFNTLPCNDNNACTGQDKCSAGSCFGTQLPCNDGNPCTDDSCNTATGCKADNNTAPCNDNNPCTAADACLGGKCVGGTQVNCSDSNPCTIDSCDPAAGGCKFTPGNDKATCTDGSACTIVDQCGAGKCIGTALPACDDNNPCTSTACDPIKGCLFAPQGGPCSDGNACTGTSAAPDACNAVTAECKAGAAVQCNDGNPCTADACGTNGCAYTQTTNPCDDGQLCTINDKCSAGSCKGGSGAPDQDGDGYGTKACGGADCDDDNKLAHPGMKETCSTGFDDNCDGVINEVGAFGCTMFGHDGDGDGYPSASAAGAMDTQCLCAKVLGNPYSADITKPIDCNDLNSKVNPGAKEDCKTTDDDNCAGGTNEAGALSCTVFFGDGDGDSFYANGAAYQCQCAPTTTFSATKSGDCDDTSSLVHPNAVEDCETTGDDNCNGATNEKDAKNCTPWLLDADHDGHAAGAAAGSQCLCGPLGDYTASPQNTSDCNDGSYGISPAAPEVCDSYDNNCNGAIDDGCDGDGDGYCAADKWVVYGAKCAASKKPGALATTLGRLLVLTADTTGVPAKVREVFKTHNVHEGVDLRPVGGVTPAPVMPTAYELRRYGAVVLLVDPAGSGIAKPDLLGDALAEYVQGGGGVVVFHAAGAANVTPGGKFAASGMKPFQTDGTWKSSASPTLSTAAGYGPAAHPLNLVSTLSTAHMTTNVVLGSFAFATAAGAGGNFEARTWVNEGSTGPMPFAVDSGGKWLGRVVGLNFRPGTDNQYLDQFARNGAHFVQRAWGDDCSDSNPNINPGSPADATCDGVDQNCDGFDYCPGSTCSPPTPIDAPNGWEIIGTTGHPTTTLPGQGAWQSIDSGTAWKFVSWANAPGSTGGGIAFGPVDLPPASQVAPGYPDTGQQWQVARYTFTAQDTVKRFEFRYRYLPDPYEGGQAIDAFSVRLDQPKHALLDLTAGAATAKGGGWKTQSYVFTAPLQAGAHSIYLFFKTGDGAYNNGLGAAFDHFRVCNQ